MTRRTMEIMNRLLMQHFNGRLRNASMTPIVKEGYTQPGGGIGPVSLYNPVGYALEIVDDKSVASFNASLMGEYKFWDFPQIIFFVFI